MSCEKVVENVTWIEARVVEERLCRRFGLLCDGTGQCDYVDANLDDRSLDLMDIVEGREKPNGLTLDAIEGSLWGQLARSNRLANKLRKRMRDGAPLTAPEYYALCRAAEDEARQFQAGGPPANTDVGRSRGR
jgi:hypothetical protein